MAVTACYLLIVLIEFSLSSPSLHGSLLLVTPLCRLSPGQRLHAAILVVRSTAAPSEMALTTTMLCVSPATKATRWKARQQPSARPTASGASSHRHAEVWSRAGKRLAALLYLKDVKRPLVFALGSYNNYKG